MNEAETWVVENQRWFFHVARQFRQNPHLVEELAQEGMLQALKAAKRYDGRGTLVGWMQENARLTIKHCAFPPNRKPAADLIEKPFDVQGTLDLEDLWDAADDDYSQVYLRKHLKEIQEAVANLPEKELRYVHRKFYQGATTRELQEEFGLGCAYLWKSARLKLHRTLAHLEGLI